MTIPNLLTFLRLALTPVAAVLAYSSGSAGRACALGIFLLAMATDVADGIVAKLPGQSSRLGLYLDPVTDKIIVLTMFFVLADLELLPLWMGMLMMARELVVDGFRSAAATSGEVVGSNVMGKTKGVLQTVCIGLGLALRTLSVDPPQAWLWVTVCTGLTLVVVWIFAGIFLWKNRALVRQAAKHAKLGERLHGGPHTSAIDPR
jgi:CDP-diacylglycerol--glycerol-3-phosphate 3-phosphatidyltransferase